MNSSIQVMLAEDNPADVYLVRDGLSGMGIDCELYVVGDGEQAIQFIQRTDATFLSTVPDVVLLDLHLPKHDGEEILRLLRSSKRCGRIPVIVMTSSDSPRDRAMVEKNAAVYFLKPTDLDEFREIGTVVKRVLAKAKAQCAG